MLQNENKKSSNLEVVFLVNAKKCSLVLDSKNLAVFYQTKIAEVTVISAKRTDKAMSSESEISKFCKPKRSIYED